MVWSRPLVESVVLPTHTETSPAGCTVRIIWFNDSNDDEICLTVEALNGDDDPLPPPGTYLVEVTANFDGGNFVEDYEGTITCCTGETFNFDGELTGESGGTESEPVAVVTVTEDGDCSIDPPVTKPGP